MLHGVNFQSYSNGYRSLHSCCSPRRLQKQDYPAWRCCCLDLHLVCVHLLALSCLFPNRLHKVRLCFCQYSYCCHIANLFLFIHHNLSQASRTVSYVFATAIGNEFTQRSKTSTRTWKAPGEDIRSHTRGISHLLHAFLCNNLYLKLLPQLQLHNNPLV